MTAAAWSVKSGTSDLAVPPQIRRSCSSCCSRANHFPFRFIRTMRTRSRWGWHRGKTEAWYILSAAPGAKIALGLKKRLAPRQLREAVDDGSIAGLVAWRTVLPGDVVSVPAGTIHAIGAGLVIAEIQQRSDATFRMFDFGRKRELHVARRRRRGRRGAGRRWPETEAAHGRTDASGIQPAFRVRTDRTGAGLRVPPRGGTRDLAARCQRQRPRREVRRRHGRRRFCAVGQRRHTGRARGHGGPRGVHGCRWSGSTLCCSALHNRAQRMRHRRRRCRCQRSLTRQRRPRCMGTWEQCNEATPARCAHRQSSSAPLRNRHLHP